MKFIMIVRVPPVQRVSRGTRRPRVAGAVTETVWVRVIGRPNGARSAATSALPDRLHHRTSSRCERLPVNPLIVSGHSTGGTEKGAAATRCGAARPTAVGKRSKKQDLEPP
ncbi:hypothetical protein ABZU75_22285 [Streptosporangium sp. NPDC005286]|uniref:hypothetical protein n=1 Tax=Streptosporangium sp. NPDC005286 TaxID=3154463 RepID=UPI0033A16C1E